MEAKDCTHAHGDDCGYGETVSVTSPCTHRCEDCQAPAEPLPTPAEPESDNAEEAEQSEEFSPMLSPDDTEPYALDCICPDDGGSTRHTDSDCPFYALEVPMSKGRAANVVPEGVTVTVVKEYVYNIYANGNPIIIQQGHANNAYGFIYIDANENGAVDEDEPPVALDGVLNYPEAGYYLQNSNIYGGCESANLEGDTSVTMNSGLLWSIYGGGLDGDVSGTVTVNMTGGGGQIVNVLGASAGDTGDVYLNFSGDSYAMSAT